MVELARIVGARPRWSLGPIENRSVDGHDLVMDSNTAAASPLSSPAASAHALQRAAGALQKHAMSTLAVDTLPVTVAHVQEALDRLSVGMEQMANAVAEWSGEYDSHVADDALQPEARALRWHLRSIARELRASRDACSGSREWSRRLLDGHRHAGVVTRSLDT